MEGHELRPPRVVLTGAKGKGKAATSSELPSTVEKSTSLPSLKALMTDPSLFEESLLKDPDEEVISFLGFMYGKEVTKNVQDPLRDFAPFQMAASVSIYIYFCWSFQIFVLDTTTVVDELFWHLHGEIL